MPFIGLCGPFELYIDEFSSSSTSKYFLTFFFSSKCVITRAQALSTNTLGITHVELKIGLLDENHKSQYELNEFRISARNRKSKEKYVSNN